MADAATLILTLDPDLLDRFVAEADAAMRPADDVLRDLVRDFVDGRRSSRDAEIERALREADDPRTAFVSDEEVEAEWLRERAHLLRRIDDDAA
jgi:predicted transcriptional regulator